MKHYFILLMLLGFSSPLMASDFVTGIDDFNPNITKAEQLTIDDAITTYYQHPDIAKINTVLDIMNGNLLEKKTAWSPLVGFLTIVFSQHKHQVFDWISRNDYNLYAQDVIITALMHAKLFETAAVFAQGVGWTPERVEDLRKQKDTTDLKHQAIILPGHIDALWGAFFASGDKIYVEEILNVLFMTKLPVSDAVQAPAANVLLENKKLAVGTLTLYCKTHPLVKQVIEKRLKKEKDSEMRAVLQGLLSDKI